MLQEGQKLRIHVCTVFQSNQRPQKSLAEVITCNLSVKTRKQDITILKKLGCFSSMVSGLMKYNKLKKAAFTICSHGTVQYFRFVHMVLWTARRLRWFCVNRIPVCKHTNFQLVKINVVAGFPVFLFPALLDHVTSFFFLVVRSYLISVGAIHTRQLCFNAWQRIYILFCTDWLVLSEV